MGWKEKQQLSHVEDQVLCTFEHVGRLKDCLTPKFASELSSKEEDTFDLTSNKGKNWANLVRKNKKMIDAICASLDKSCSIKQAQLCNKSQYRLAIQKGT
jgi:hypothetical protein